MASVQMLKLKQTRSSRIEGFVHISRIEGSYSLGTYGMVHRGGVVLSTPANHYPCLCSQQFALRPAAELWRRRRHGGRGGVAMVAGPLTLGPIARGPLVQQPVLLADLGKEEKEVVFRDCLAFSIL